MSDPDSPESPESSAMIIAAAHARGFALAGIAPARPTSYATELREWLSEGRHGEMAWLERNEAVMCDPDALLPGARSIICVADRYADGRPDAAWRARRGRVARYARGRDYHSVMRKRLIDLAKELQAAYPAEQFRTFVDAGPVLEREHAERAGLGAVGKNTLLLERGAGSWLLLGEIITTMNIRPSLVRSGEGGDGGDGGDSGRPQGDPCGSCTRCIDACPTDAITPYRVDATRCISYLTIEHRGPIDPEYFAAIGDWLFGCDICQEVCPHSRPTRRSRKLPRNDAYAPRRDGFDLLEVLGWSEEDRRRAFETSALKRAKLDMMKRNALIVAGNHLAREEDPALRARIAELAADPVEPELVRETAKAVLGRLT